MNFVFGKQSAKVCIEQIVGRLRQYVNDLPDDTQINIDQFAERLTFCFLNELTEANLPLDPQLIISAAMGMNHACMQFIAAEVPDPLNSPTVEIWYDEKVH
jgi:hypothetical protein